MFARIDSNVDWYLGDHQGSITDMTDSSGILQNHIEYDGYGNVVSETNSSFGDRYKYTSREWDAEIDLQYNRARFYDPSIGRWISEDPIGFSAGDTNLQRYVNNSPTNATDPSGLWIHILAGAGLGAAVGVGGQALSDWYHGKFSGFEAYVGAGAGGAVGGAILAGTGNATAAGAAAGFVGNGLTQGLRYTTGKQESIDPIQVGVSTTAGAVGGKLAHHVAPWAGGSAEYLLTPIKAAHPLTIGATQGLVTGSVVGGVNVGTQATMYGGIKGYMKNGWSGAREGWNNGLIQAYEDGMLWEGAILGGGSGMTQGAIVGSYYQFRPWQNVTAQLEINSHGGLLSTTQPQTTTVPSGNSVRTFAPPGGSIAWGLSNHISKGRIPADAFTKVYGPGDVIPNYTFDSPAGRTNLHSYLRENQGRGMINFNACPASAEGNSNSFRTLTQDRLYIPVLGQKKNCLR